MSTTSDARRRFQDLLRELFEFDCADLDFGIYRIMNHKRQVIEEWIEKKLPETITQVLRQGELADQAQAQQELQTAREEVIKALGKHALDPEGNLQEAFHSTIVGRQYLEARARAAGTRAIEALEAEVYNHLYTFFSRYWQDGDFISKRRYSAKERYAIPYNGEEVYLYWANRDQYYIKTGEYFTDYAYKAPNGVTVRFKLRNADVEQNNVKGEKRFFLVETEAIEWDKEERTLTIPVVFRPLTGEETERYGQRNQQEAILQAAVKDIVERAHRFGDDNLIAALTGERSRDGERSISHLEYHLRRYTRRNTSDFFIHKDLRGFLSRELDFYLKNEVLNLDEIEAAGEHRAEGWFQLLRAIKRVGAQIIEFLAQIEDFQKMIWEKKKFVTETFYVITVGSIPESFYPEIAACEAQWREWEALFSLSALRDGLFSGDLETQEGRIAFLRAHPTLTVDTRHFTQEFVDRLLAVFEDLDRATDGLLVHSENWQALNMLRAKYSGCLQCVYIDPPYNTDSSPIIYKNDYKKSSWLSMMTERVRMGAALLNQAGVFVIAIDDEEVSGLRFVLDDELYERLGVAVVRSNPAGRKTKGKLAPAHEYALFYGKSQLSVPSSLEEVADRRVKRFPLKDERGNYAWANFIRSGSNDRREDRPKLFYPIFVKGEKIRIPKMEWDEGKGEYRLLEQPEEGEEVVYPVVIQSGKVIEKNWQRGHARVMEELDQYRVSRNADGSISIYFKTYMDEDSLPSTWWEDAGYASANYGAMELKALFGEKIFDFSKAVKLVRDCIVVGGMASHSSCIDFFAGSGTTAHAVINLNREDGGRRKFILVEMAHYFDTVLLPRVKKVIFTPEWKDGKPKRLPTSQEAERSPRIVKVIRLESYEDALNNLAFDEEGGKAFSQRFGDDYLLRYMLKWETRKSETLLDVEKLQAPFSYRLHIRRDGETQAHPVDLPETFVYLLGMDVKTRRVCHDEGRRYVVYRGVQRDGRTVVVIWRDIRNWTLADYERDRDFVLWHGLTDEADEIFVNGDSLIPKVRSLDPVFKARLFSEPEV